MAQQFSPETIREFVIAAHFNLDKVKSMLAENPDLLNVEHQWGEDDYESGIGAAAHVGNRPIAEFFLAQGVTSNICVAAMLGRLNEVQGYLEQDRTQANAHGAHSIPVLFHAAMSGNVEIAALLKAQGCTEGYDIALHGAIASGHKDMVAWLLDNGASDVTVKNYEDKTPLAKAIEGEHAEIADLLRERGATE